MNSRFDAFDSDGFDGFVDSRHDARDGAAEPPIIVACRTPGSPGAARLVRISAAGSIDWDISVATLWTGVFPTPLGILCYSGATPSGSFIDIDLETRSYVDGSQIASASLVGVLPRDPFNTGDTYVFSCGDQSGFYGTNRGDTGGSIRTYVKLNSDLSVNLINQHTAAGRPASGAVHCMLNGDGTIRAGGGLLTEGMRHMDPDTLEVAGTSSFAENFGVPVLVQAAGVSDGDAIWACVDYLGPPGAATQALAGDKAPAGLNQGICMGSLHELWQASGGATFAVVAYEYGLAGIATAVVAWRLLAADVVEPLDGWTAAAERVRRYPDGDLVVMGTYTKTGEDGKVWIVRGTMERPAVVGGNAAFTRKWQATLDAALFSSGEFVNFHTGYVVAAGGGVDDHGFVGQSGAWDGVEY